MGAQQEFGSCCKELKEAMTTVPNPLIFVEEDCSVLYMSVGYVKTQEGIGWMDHAVLFCPFCGTRLQSSEEIKAKAGTPSALQ